MLKKIVTVESAVKKAESYCAYQERSQQEVRDKIYSWGLHRKDVENVLIKLIEGGFLKEERFAEAFVGGKLRIKKWGRIKIRLALQQKRVSEPLIKSALNKIDQAEYLKILKDVMHSRSKLVKEKNLLKKNHKIASFLISRGFEPDLVWNLLGQLPE